MQHLTEFKYWAIFGFSFLSAIGMIALNFFNTKPTVLSELIASCTTFYRSFISHQTLLHIFFMIALIFLAVIFFLKVLLSWYKTKAHLRMATIKAQSSVPKKVVSILKKLSLEMHGFIIVKDKRPLAYTAGLKDAKIILSTGLIKLLSPKQLEAVILHERYHQKNRHGALYLIAESVSQALVFIVPVLHDVIVMMKQELENLADRYALERQGSKKYLAASLLKVAHAGNTHTVFPSFISPIEERAQIYANPVQGKSSLKSEKVIISVISFVALAIVSLVPSEKDRAEAQAYQVEACVRESSCGEVCQTVPSIGMSKIRFSSSNLPASVF